MTPPYSPKEVKMFEIINAKQSFKRIKNAKNILELAASFTTIDKIENASYSDNEEWFDQFWERASYISDKEAQVIWGKILAKEIDKKGSTPKGLFRILSEIDSNKAKAFQTLCEHRLYFVFLDEQNDVKFVSKELVIFHDEDDYYIKKNLTLPMLNELESLGLISSSIGLHKKIHNIHKILISDGVSCECLIVDDKEELSVGSIMFTEAGVFLCEICNNSLANDQMNVMKKYYERYGYSFDENNKIKVIPVGESLRLSNLE